MLKQPLLQCVLNGLLFIASVVLVFWYIKTLLVLAYFPIYPDEIAIRLWLSRAVFDFPMHVNIIPSSENFLLPLAFVWYLPGLIEWLLHGVVDNLHTLRLVGLALYVLIAGMLTHLLIVQSKKSLVMKRVIGLGIVLSFLSIGVLPVFFITNRPEQIILLCLIISLILLHYVKNTNACKRMITLSIIIFYSCVSLMLYVHPKALYLTPFYCFIAYFVYLQLPKKPYSYFVFVLLTVLLLGNFSAWNNTLQFEKSPSVKQYMNSFNINPADLILNPSHFFSQIQESIMHEDLLLNKLVFQNHTDIDYLPSLQIGIVENRINNIIEFNAVALFFSLFIVLLCHYYKDISRGQYTSSRLLLILLLGSAVAGNLLNLTKTWYDVGYFWAIVIIVAIAYLADIYNLLMKSVVSMTVFLYLIVSAIFSLKVFNDNYRDKLFEGYVGPSVSLINFKYDQYQSDAKIAAKNCLIDHKNSHGLVLDDYTYLYFRQSKNPMLVTYINHHTDSNKFPELIKSGQVTAIIVRCAIMPLIPHMQEKSVLKFGSICCYPENKIRELM